MTELRDLLQAAADLLPWLPVLWPALVAVPMVGAVGLLVAVR